MFKIFSTALRVSPVILTTVLGFTDNAFGSEAPTVLAESNQIVTICDQPTSYVKQNIQNPKSDALTQVTSFSQQWKINPTFILRNSLTNIEVPAAQRTQDHTFTVADQPTTISSPEALYRPTQKSDTSTQVTSVSQTTNLAGRSEAVTEKFNITPPLYSMKASDLWLDSSSQLLDLSQYYLYNSPIPNKQISQAVTPNPNQPETPPDKSQYNLFHPTPRKLREFNTDRPNLATSPLTVDAGIFQIEADVVNYTRKGSDESGNTREKFLFASTTLRVGLTNNVEFRLLFQPYNLARTTFRGTGEVQQNAGLDILRAGSNTNTPTTSRRPGEVQQNAGFDTLQAGFKINIYGNDTYKKPGATAFGLLPFINIPTARYGLGSNSIEGGLASLFIYKISDTLDLEVQPELDIIKNGESSGYHVESFNVVSLDYQITKPLGTFFEIATRFNNESRFGAIVTFDTGLLINIGNDTQLDIGAFIGLTRAADDINPFLGLSKRF